MMRSDSVRAISITQSSSLLVGASPVYPADKTLIDFDIVENQPWRQESPE